MTRLFVFLFCCIALVSAGHLRFGHYSPDAPSVVDVYFNDVFVASASFGSPLSTYFAVTTNQVNVHVKASNATPIAIPVTVGDTEFVTLVAFSDEKKLPFFKTFSDPLSSPDIGAKKARVRFLFTVAAQTATFLVGADTLFTNVAAAQPTAYLDVNSGNSNFSFAYDNQVITLSEIPLTIGYVYTFVGLSNKLLLPATDANFQRASVRVVHASPDAPTVDITVGKTLFGGLSFTQQSSYADVVPGNLQVNITAGGNTVLSESSNFEGLRKYTAVAHGFVAPPTGNTNKLAVSVYEDEVVPTDLAWVNVVNFVPDSQPLLINLGDGSKNDTFVYGNKKQKAVVGGTYTVSVYAGTPSTLNPSRVGRRIRRRVNGVLLDYVPVSSSTLTFNNGTLYYVFIEGSGGKYNIVVDSNTPSPSPSSGSSGLSGGAIAGIVIACIVGSILIIGIIVYFWRRTKYSSIP